MAKHLISRNDIQALARRMEDRAWSPLMNDMPELQRDLRTAAIVLKHALDIGFPVNPIELDAH